MFFLKLILSFLLFNCLLSLTHNIFEYINSLNTTWKANTNIIISKYKNLLGVPLNYKYLSSTKLFLINHSLFNISIPI